MAAAALLMATWWITDAIPLYATALLPLILYPLLGIEQTRATAPIYFNSTIVLFLGGFMIALTMEKWDVHRRIALWVIRSVGGGPARIVLGFMLAAAFLSMWISNTATAIMMLPVGLAVILRMEEQFGKERTRTFSVAVMLGIAYACSAGASPHWWARRRTSRWSGSSRSPSRRRRPSPSACGSSWRRPSRR